MSRSKMKTVVIGANGQLGHDVVVSFQNNGDDVHELNHDQIRIEDIDSTSSVLQEIKPDVIINTAALHHVEDCEEQPAESFAVNGIGSRNLALVANDLNALLIHISTDYVFDGEKNSPYLESDLPVPLNVYGNTKLAGEHFIRSIAEKYHILRVSGIYGHAPCRAKGLNFVDLMLKLGNERDEVRVVNDEEISPTNAEDIASQIVQFSRSEAYGLYHVTAEGSCTWYEFAKEIFQTSGVKTRLEIADPSEFPTKVPRPKYSVLANSELKRNNLQDTLHWKDGLKSYLKNGN
jgi:dTDP-4-dehydrorhamnose reductase